MFSLAGLGTAVASFFTIENLLLMVLGVAVGIFGGALPGVSITMTVALMSTLTYTMSPTSAVVLLLAAQVGATFGGSISATVLNVPGTPAHVVCAIEGNPIYKRGQGELALGVNLFTNFMGNTLGVIFFLITMPFFMLIAMELGSWEMFWFSAFGLIIASNLSQGSTLKSYIAALIGVLVSCVGMDSVDGYPRFAFGSVELSGGISFIPALIGIYGMSEVFLTLTDSKMEGNPNNKTSMKQAAKYWWSKKWLCLKTAVVGFLIGVAPGLGANASCWVGYDSAKRSSKHKEEFGKGSLEGLIGSNSAIGATVGGAYCPMLTLGVPGDGASAIVLGIFTMQGIFPGPTFLKSQPEWMYLVALAILFSGFVMVAVGLVSNKALIRLFCATPAPAMAAVIASLCIMGAYAYHKLMSDVIIMLVFGVVGLLFKLIKVPTGSMVLGMVLGSGLMDLNFRRALIAGRFSFVPFFTRPVSIALIVIILIVVIGPYIRPQDKKEKEARAKASEAGSD